MSFVQIFGQERAKRILQNGLRLNKVSHAYLFNGPQGTGRTELALTFTKALFCERMTDDTCGECPSCRKIEHGNHPDIYRITPGEQSIKINQIRELKQGLSYHARASGRKVYIIEQAEKMTMQAANSLLKFLEEPMSPIVAILITHNEQAILPTIRSRSLSVPFSAQNPNLIYKILIKGDYPTKLALAAAHLVDSIEAGRDLCKQHWFAEMRSVMLQLGNEYKLSSTLLNTQQKLFKTELIEYPDMLFRLFHLWFRDMLNYQYNRQESVVFIDQLGTVGKLAWTKSTEEWIRCMDAALKAQKRVRAHVSLQLACEQFLFEIQGGT